MVDYSTQGILASAKTVLLSPSRFYSHMPRSGGYAAPALFVVAMAVLAALLSALLEIPADGFFHALKFFVVKSVLWSACSLLVMAAGGIAYFVISKLLGGNANLETAVRGTAYAFAMLPVLVVLKLVPALGLPAGILYTAWLLVMAGVHALGVSQGKAIAVFGVLAVIAIWCSFGCDDESAQQRKAPSQVQENTGVAREKTPAHTAKSQAPASDSMDSNPVAVEKKSAAVKQGAGQKPVDQAAAAAENAGRVLGELVRETGEAARKASENIATGIATGVESSVQGVREVVSGIEQKAAGAAGQVQQGASEAGLTPEAVGQAVGSIAKKVGDAAREVSEGFKAGVQSGKESATAAKDDAAAVAAEPVQAAAVPAASSAAAATESTSQSQSATQPSATTQPPTTNTPAQAAATASPPAQQQATGSAGESAADAATGAAEAMTPEELGAALGAFINSLNEAAGSAASGLEQGLQGEQAAGGESDSAAADAGEVLGRFLRGFSESVNAEEGATAQGQ